MGTNSHCQNSYTATTNSASNRKLPIILLLGPPGSGKGTICTQLASDFNLRHLSVGDWLRAQTAAPIVDVPDHINAYVARGEVVPEELLEIEYGPGREAAAPPPLTLYNCSKRNVSTPESMKYRLMPTLKGEIESLSAQTWPDKKKSWRWRDRSQAVLLDNAISTRVHAEAAAATFGRDFPMLAIAVECSDETAEARFLARGRGNDDVARFKRRIARYHEGAEDVLGFLRGRGTPVVAVNTEGEAEEVYRGLLDTLFCNKVWRAMQGGPDGEQASEAADAPFAEMRCQVGVQSCESQVVFFPRHS